MIYYNKVKKGLFGKKLVGKVDDKEVALKMPKGSKVRVEVQDKGFIVKDGKEAITSVFDELTFDEQRPHIMIARKNDYYYTKVLVDCKTGKHTPECRKVAENYVIDGDENILRLDEELNTTPTGLKRVDYDYHANFTVCQRKNGKYIVVDSRNLNRLIEEELDTPKVKSSFKIYAENGNDVLLRCLTVDGTHYLVDNDGGLVKKLQGTEIEEKYVYESGNNKYISCYDENTNKTQVVVYNRHSEEIVETFEVENELSSIYSDYQKMLFVTKDKNNKMGVVSKEGAEVIPHSYDEVSSACVGTRFNDRDLFVLKNNDKVGIASIEGEQLLPVEYDDIEFKNSSTYKEDVRFFAKKGEHYGVVNGRNEVEVDFIYDHEHLSVDAPFYVKGKEPSDRLRGLQVRNTVTGKTDYLNVGNEKPVYQADEIEEYHYSSGHERRKVTKTVEVDKYSDSEIASASIFTSILFESPIAGMFTAEYMKDQKETKTIEVDEDGPSYDY